MSELLHLVKVKEGVVQLTLFGEAVNLGTIDDKKKVLRKQLIKLEPFKTILQLIKKEGQVYEKEIIAHLKSHGMVIEDTQRFHKLMLTWGGYTEIFEYDGSKQIYTAALTPKSLED